MTLEDCLMLHSPGELGGQVSSCPSTTSTKHPPLLLPQQAFSAVNFLLCYYSKQHSAFFFFFFGQRLYSISMVTLKLNVFLLI